MRVRPSRFARTVEYGLLAGFFAFMATPMLIVVVFSFDARRFPTIPWGGFSLDWHRAIWADQMVTNAFSNSLIVGLGTAAISTVLGFAAAYVDYRAKFFGKTAFMLSVAIPPAVPATVMGVAMLAFLSRLGLSGSPFSIILCHVVIAVSFAMAIIRLRLGEMAEDLEPAARNLGASPLRALFLVVLPFCRRSLAAAFLLSAAVSFDEFMLAWFVGGVNETIPVRILNQLQGQVNPKINAMGTIVLIVSIALVLLAQRFAGLKLDKDRPS